MFKPGSKLYAYEVEREAGENVMYVNYLGAPFVPSIADSPEVMSRTIELLIESESVSRIVFVQQRNYNYDFAEVSMLLEIANLYNHLIKQERILSPEKLRMVGQEFVPGRYEFLSYILILLKRDPIACYVEVKNELIHEKGVHEGSSRGSRRVGGGGGLWGKDYEIYHLAYLRLLEKILSLLENTKLIKLAEPFLDSYQPGTREIYAQFFRPDIIPNFTFTRLVSAIPKADILDQYDIATGYDKSTVTILKKENEAKCIYHLMPPEYTLNEDQHMLLNLARNVLIEHRPKAEEFTDPERTRQVFFNVSRDLLRDLAENKRIGMEYSELNKLANILVRHTIGFGLIEILLQDENLQDVVLNAPIPQNNVFVRHAEFDECVTNIIPSQEDIDSWAAKFRMLSGRPLDEANPVLDTELSLGKSRARVAIIQQPLSPHGLAYAFRRHRDKPWTLPLFINNKMLNSFSAGLLSFLVQGGRTLLVSGTRSSGKTSLLGALMLEIMPKFRVIVLEDTLELPADSLRKLGYDILRMKVRSALLEKTTEVAADEGIRTSLRLGDSCLILGEVRSVEARALFEAMRIGALANVVAGTIHGASPYAVFDRVVNDLEVPVTSFKAIDTILVANPIKSADGLHSWKRLIQLAEVRKKWTRDPLDEHGFVDLLKYSVEKDELEASQELINGESDVVKAIASSVKGWVGNWDAVYDNILLRGKIKQEIVDMAEKLKMPELLEAEFNSLSNNAFYEISDKIRKEVGLPVSNRVFPLWQGWLKRQVKRASK